MPSLDQTKQKTDVITSNVTIFLLLSQHKRAINMLIPVTEPFIGANGPRVAEERRRQDVKGTKVEYYQHSLGQNRERLLTY